MRRLNDDSGAVAIIVAFLLATVFLAMGALVVDAGQLYSEKRELQNGADAAALAIAQGCADNGLTAPCSGLPTAPTALAQTYADSNATDGKSAVDSVAFPTTRSVTVATSTETGSGGTFLPAFFGKAVMGSSYNGTVHARATAAWGPPKANAIGIPLTISVCEWNTYTNGGTTYLDPNSLPTSNPLPPAGDSAWPTSPPEVHLYFHDTTGASPCTVDADGNPVDPSQSGSDLPGGFGWLDTNTGCQATTSVDNWFDDSTGSAVPSDCTVAQFKAMVGHVIYVPVFGQVNGLTGANGQYEITGYAAFYLTGFNLAGLYKKNSIATGWNCSGSSRCISGWFTTGTLDALPDTSGGGTYMGATAVGLTG